jgi:hypothetical protein
MDMYAAAIVIKAKLTIKMIAIVGLLKRSAVNIGWGEKSNKKRKKKKMKKTQI